MDFAKQIKSFFKNLLASLADVVFRLQGLMLPDYITPRHRIDLLFFGNEQDVVNVMKRKLKSGMRVLDVGANIGLITRICAKIVTNTGHVVAFEPDPYTRKYLDHNLKDYSNVTVSSIALSDENTKTAFNIHPISGTSNSLIAFDDPKEIIEVDCMTVDSYLKHHPAFAPNIVKIDVEGAELRVLAGMRETLAMIPDLILVIEYCPENLAKGGITPEQYYAMLDEVGLCAEIIRKDGSTEPLADLADLTSKLGSEIYCNLLCYRKS